MGTHRGVRSRQACDAAFEQELKLSFKMGVDAQGDTWKKGIYDGVVEQGMAKLKIR